MTESHWWRPSASLDATRIGGQNYTQAEVRLVMAALEHADFLHPLNNATVALTTGVPGRTVRQIISDLDGRVMLIGKRSAGLFVCHWADEAAEYTGALSRHWRSERARVRQRRKFLEGFPRMQGQMFDADSLYDDEDEDDDD